MFEREVIDRDGDEGAQSPWGNGRIPDAKPGCQSKRKSGSYDKCDLA